MRFTVRTMLGVLLLGSLCEVTTAESRSGFWPFGRNEQAAATQSNAHPATLEPQAQAPAMQPGASVPITPIEPGEATAAQADQNWMLKSPWAKISWPRLNVPSFASNETETTAARNTWVEPERKPDQSSPLTAMKRGARRVGDSTKNAWHSTVDALTPGDNAESSRSSIAQRQTRPSFWKRMFVEESAANEPETIPEWMAQERLNP